MEIVDYRIDRKSKGHVFSLYAVADMHVGNPGFDYNHFAAHVKTIKDDPDAYWIGLGDYADWVSIGDKRFQVANLDPEDDMMLLEDFYQKMFERVAEKLSPIMDRCIGLSYGNHEMTICNKNQYDPVKRLCERFQVNNLGWSSFVRLRFARKCGVSMYKIFCSHGTVAGGRKGGKINKMENSTADFDADIYLKAHGHEAIGGIKTTLKVPTRGERRLIAHNKIFMMASSFLKTYNVGSRNYGEIKEYAPSSIASAKIEIEPWKKTPKMRLIQEVCSGKYSK